MSRVLSNIVLTLNTAKKEDYLKAIDNAAKNGPQNGYNEQTLLRMMKKIESWNSSIFNTESNKYKVNIKRKIVKIEFNLKKEFEEKNKNAKYKFKTKAAKECYKTAEYLLQLEKGQGKANRKQICSHAEDFAYLKYGSGEAHEIPLSMQIEAHRKTWFWPIKVAFSEVNNNSVLLIERNDAKLSKAEVAEGEFREANNNVATLRKNSALRENNKSYIVTYNGVEEKYDANKDSRFIAVFRQRHGTIDRETCQQITTVDPGQLRKIVDPRTKSLVISLEKLQEISKVEDKNLELKDLLRNGNKQILTNDEIKLCNHNSLFRLSDFGDLTEMEEIKRLSRPKDENRTENLIINPHEEKPDDKKHKYDAIDEYKVFDGEKKCKVIRKFEDDRHYVSYTSSRPSRSYKATKFHAWVRLRKGGKVYSVGKSADEIGPRFAKDTKVAFHSADNHEFEDQRGVFRECPMQVTQTELENLEGGINRRLHADKKEEYNTVRKNCVRFVFDVFKDSGIFQIEEEQNKDLNINMLRVFFPSDINDMIDEESIPDFLIYLAKIISLPFRFATRPISRGFLILCGAGDTAPGNSIRETWEHFCFKDVWQVAHPLAAHRFMKQNFPEKSANLEEEEADKLKNNEVNRPVKDEVKFVSGQLVEIFYNVYLPQKPSEEEKSLNPLLPSVQLVDPVAN